MAKARSNKQNAQRYIAFLRAINVGGHTVKMDRLRALFEALKAERVETFIASGNVIFEASTGDAAALEEQIEAHLKKALGYEVATFLRSPSELAAVAAHEPFTGADKGDPTAEGYALYIAFLKEEPSREATQKLLRLKNEVDDFRVHGREAYWLRRNNLVDTKFTGAVLEKALGMPATLRNVTTVRKLAAKYPA